ncbi:hypothetical protein TeGR_g14192 [Tetraparma gracilis]|jgi:hypothetical protein|uniref:BCNT-C domain-containing protein n=1 Tax=Tetraparma gracilis TaxID=2962635 RepID=A0ABQ6M7J8_9STRA|nr:hypothetical protein TeGR_g14192 [Tetraparma gracilis]
MPKAAQRTEDESDAEDDDYVYQAPSDDEGEDASAKLEAGETLLVGISEHRRSAIDDMFAEMSGSKPAGDVAAKKKGGKKGKVAKKEKRAKSLLSGIFGSSAAKKLVKNKPLDLSAGREKRELHAVKKVVVEETKKFAGKNITVKKTVLVDKNVKAPPAGLDGLLDDLKGPQKMSTIAKTATDWDNHVEETGMGEELQKATQDGYLVKKDFLNRVDERKFEIEKQARERERLKK